MEMYHYRCRLPSEHFARMRRPIHPETLKKGNFYYEWIAARLRIVDDLNARVPNDASCVFVDDWRVRRRCSDQRGDDVFHFRERM
jgi:hypothetical protein